MLVLGVSRLNGSKTCVKGLLNTNQKSQKYFIVLLLSQNHFWKRKKNVSFIENVSNQDLKNLFNNFRLRNTGLSQNFCYS
jgi:hypothetical protein